MTFEELAKVVANEFKQTMKEEGFDSFKEMAECYWWTANDIKDEVDVIISNAVEGLGVSGIDEVDRTDVYLNGDMISYRKFSAMWHKALNDR